MTAALCGLVIPAARAVERAGPAQEEFSSVTTAVVTLLETGDAAAFAKILAPSTEDWRVVVGTNRNAAGEDPLDAAWQKSLTHQQTRLESDARALLAKAAELNVDFSQLQLTGRAVTPKGIGTVRNFSFQSQKESLPWAEKLEVVVTVKPATNTPASERLGGEYKLSVGNLTKFPAGWRASEGARWVSFPPTVVDEKTQREMAILEKVATRAAIDQADDPALLQLGEALVHFVQAGEVKVFENEALLNANAAWDMIQKLSGGSGRKSPTRAEVDKQMALQLGALVPPAQAMVAQMKTLGIDLKDADVQVEGVAVQRLTARGGPGTVEGLDGNQLLIKLAVKSSQVAKSGMALSGEYVIAAEEAMRIGGRWFISRPVRWEKFPEGVADEKTLADISFESYVAEHGALPPGTVAPDIEFISINDEKPIKLSTLRGKVVVLDFWATWCGPCQEPMAELQKIRVANPEWKDRVVIVSLSIDDTLKQVRGHLDKRGWTNTLNVWAGEGGWQAAPAKAFRVSGVPTCYVIDSEGKVRRAGHPAGLQVSDMVNQLLK